MKPVFFTVRQKQVEVNAEKVRLQCIFVKNSLFFIKKTLRKNAARRRRQKEFESRMLGALPDYNSVELDGVRRLATAAPF
ncbi:hypothetical protein Ddc_22963 [Ditylenchus destructor]|nr:hypothetical protein Ddc_22963 [Ditylenchus destructor]